MFEFSSEDREIEFHTFDVLGNYIGLEKVLVPAHQGPPNRTLPADVVLDENPKWNSDFRRVEYENDIGVRWFVNSSGEKIEVETNSALPDELPEKEGFVVDWVDGSYVYIEDHRGKTIYSKEDGSAFEVKDLGPIKSGYTELERPDDFHVFEGDEWVYKIDLHTPIKTLEMRDWRNYQLSKVVAMIDKHRIDQDAPEEFKSAKNVDENKLLELYALRKALQDFPECEDFPFCQLIEIPEWLN